MAGYNKLPQNMGRKNKAKEGAENEWPLLKTTQKRGNTHGDKPWYHNTASSGAH